MSYVFYDCRGSERLEHESVEDAVEEWLELLLEPGCDVLAVIRANTPVTVTEYHREGISDGFVESVAQALLEHAADDFAEAYGDPDGGDGGLDDKAAADALPVMKDALWKFFGRGEVWRCEEAGSRALDAEAVEGMMRVRKPSWFEEEEEEEETWKRR